MRVVHVPRGKDATLLDWVRRRAAGESAGSIAQDYGASPGNVLTSTNRVRDADMAESGEDVKEFYW